MTVTLGEVAGLIAAVALCVLVGLAAVPLLKLGRTLEEARLAIRDLGQHSVPVLTELRSTVESTNDELAKLSLVTEDLSRAFGVLMTSRHGQELRAAKMRLLRKNRPAE